MDRPLRCGDAQDGTAGPYPGLFAALDYEPQRFGVESCDVPVWSANWTTPALRCSLSRVCRRLRVDRQRVTACPPFRGPCIPIEPCGKLDCSLPDRDRLGDARYFESRAFAVCDHQLAHVYIREPSDVRASATCFGCVARRRALVRGEERGLLNYCTSAPAILSPYPRATPGSRSIWLEDRQAPDYARTVDIHRQPGYDPCELFFDPRLWWPKAGRCVGCSKKARVRYLMDVIPLDATLVRAVTVLRHCFGGPAAG